MMKPISSTTTVEHALQEVRVAIKAAVERLIERPAQGDSSEIDRAIVVRAEALEQETSKNYPAQTPEIVAQRLYDDIVQAIKPFLPASVRSLHFNDITYYDICPDDLDFDRRFESL